MAVIEKHLPGSFSWIELATTNQTSAKEFYCGVFGWSFADFPMGPGEVYTMFLLDGLNAGAAYTMHREQREQGVPPSWMLYIATADASATAAAAEAAGGKVLVPDTAVMDFGRMAVLADPAGAVFAVWQPKSHIGIQIKGVEGTLCWGDLNTPDPAGAATFYTKVFGWNISAGEHDTFGYLHIQNAGSFIGGIPSAEHRAPNTPAHWLPYFEVSNCDATTERAKAYGGRVYAPPMTTEGVGRMAVLSDAEGGVFSIFTLARK